MTIGCPSALESFSIHCGNQPSFHSGLDPTRDSFVNGLGIYGLEETADCGLTRCLLQACFQVFSASETLAHLLRTGVAPLSHGVETGGAA